MTSNGWVWCQKSTDGGQTFGSPVFVGAGYRPSMRADTAGVVYIAYQDEYADIRFSKSTDGGVSFTPGVKVNDDTNPQIEQERPSIAVNNKGQIFIVWADWRTDPPSTFSAASYDDGQTFMANVQVNESGTPGSYADIVAEDDGRVYVVYRGNIIARSTDSGQSFSYRTFITDPQWILGFSSIAASGPTVGVVGGGGRFLGDTLEVTLRFSCSSDYGQTFSPSVRVDDDPDLSDSTPPQAPSLVWKNGVFYVAWRDYHPRPNDRISFSYSSNFGQSFAPSVSVTPFDSYHLFPSLAVNDSGKAFVAWLDDRRDPVVQIDFHTFVARGTPAFVKGDLNLDGMLTPVDVAMELNAVYLGRPFSGPLALGDGNCDGRLTPTDVALLLMIVYAGASTGC